MSSLGLNGFIIQGVAAAWIYRLEGSDLGILEWVIGNPDIDKEKRREGVKAVIKECVEFGKEILGVRMLFTMCQHPNLINTYSELDFEITDTNMTHLVKELK